jgi:hypothetical protein
MDSSNQGEFGQAGQKGERRSVTRKRLSLLLQRKPYLTGSPPSQRERRCRQECRVVRVYRGISEMSGQAFLSLRSWQARSRCLTHGRGYQKTGRSEVLFQFDLQDLAFGASHVNKAVSDLGVHPVEIARLDLVSTGLAVGRSHIQHEPFCRDD